MQTYTIFDLNIWITYNSVVSSGSVAGTAVRLFSRQSTIPSAHRQGWGQLFSKPHSSGACSVRPANMIIRSVLNVLNRFIFGIVLILYMISGVEFLTRTFELLVVQVCNVLSLQLRWGLTSGVGCQTRSTAQET